MQNKGIDDLLFEVRRRRWISAAALYFMYLLFSILFMGPFLFGVISSFKDNPVEWPPQITSNQFRWTNWIGAYKIASQAGDSGFFGELQPGKNFSFEVSYLYPKGKKIEPPKVTIPKRLAGSGAAALDLDQLFASDFVKRKRVEEIENIEKEKDFFITYNISIENPSEHTFSRVPLDIKVPPKVKFVKATLMPNRSERLGMVQSWNNLTAGTIPYIFFNYSRVFNEMSSKTTGKSLFFTWIKNSFFLCIVRVFFVVIVASLAGYALARLKFRGRTLLFACLLLSMMFPPQVTFISNYLVLRDGIFGITKLFGGGSLLNTFTGLIISGVGLSMAAAIFIMKQFFEGLSSAMEEAARIDGANIYQTFFSVMLPLATPALGAVIILQFQGVWNEFFWPLVVITSPADKYPLTIGLLSMREMYGAGAFDWGPILAGSVISAIPIIILFIVFQRYFVEGMSFGAEKG